jgi:hypothetical protein
VELTESALEAEVGDEAKPRLADGRGADEARGLLRREAKEDLFNKTVSSSFFKSRCICTMQKKPPL